MASGVVGDFVGIDDSVAGGVRRIVYSGVFEAYTPYLGGDFKARTFESLDGGGVAFTGYPTAKAILGRMRWVTRILVGNAVGAGSHREAEYAARLKGADIPLIPLLYGVTSAHLGWASKRVINAVLGGLPSHWAGIAQLRVELLDAGEADPLFGSGRLRANRYDALLARGRGDVEKELLKPAKQGFRIRVTLTLDEARLQRLPAPRGSGSLNLPHVAGAAGELLSYALLLALSVFGVGKAANRGFGRFRPLPDEGVRAPGKVEDVIRRLYASDARGAQRVKSALQSLIRDALEAARGLAEYKPLPGMKGGGGVLPVLDPNRGVVDVVEARLPVIGGECGSKWVAGHLAARSLRGVPRAIEAIGVASTKSAWKTCVARQRITEPGLNLHTWLLGLPRSQKFPGKCICRNRSVRPRGLKTGYLVGAYDALGDEATVCEDGCCGGDGLPWSRAGLREARRQSMLVAYPHPAPGDGDPYIVVLLLPSRDLAALLAARGGEALYHLGPHDVRSQSKPCAEPAVNVAYALKTRDSIMGKRGGLTTVEDGSVRVVNVEDPAGRDYVRVVEAAARMFVEALKAVY